MYVCMYVQGTCSLNQAFVIPPRFIREKSFTSGAIPANNEILSVSSALPTQKQTKKRKKQQLLSPQVKHILLDI